MDAKNILIAIMLAACASAAEYTMHDYIVYDDYIDYEASQNIEVNLGSYTYTGTSWVGFPRRTNGHIDATGTGVLVTKPYNSMNPSPEWKTIDASGSGIQSIEIATADDNGNHENVPGQFSSWQAITGNQVPPGANNQYIKLRITFTGQVNQIDLTYATEMKGHPRMLVDSVAELQQRCQSEVPEQCQYLKEFADASSHYSESEWQWGTASMIYALEYVISGDNAYAQKAYNELLGDFTSYNSGWSLLAQGPALQKMFVSYDWIYNALTDSQRQQIESRIITQVDRMNNNEYHHGPYNNHLHIEQFHVLLAGIAMYGGQNQDKAEEYLDIGYDYMFNQNVPAVTKVSQGMGGWHESFSYFSYMAQQHVLPIDALRTATGVNYFEGSQGLRNIPNWYLYSTIPYDESVIHLADNGFLQWPEDKTSASGTSKGMRSYLMAMEKNFRALGYSDAAQYAQYLVENMIGELYQSGAQSLYRAGNIYDILWYEPGQAKKNIPDQALTGYSPQVGEVIMREGNSDDDTIAMFHCGDYYGGHAHYDNGHFSIWKDGYLAVDSGFYNGWGSSHQMNYARRTIAHNTLTIKKPGETFTNTDRNDGGQDFGGDTGFYGSVAQDPDDEACEMQVYSGSGYDYIDADFTDSYKENKVSMVTRQFVYIHPDYFIVFDRVHATDASYEKKYLLHSQDQMTVSADTVSFLEGNGKLFSRTLLPTDAGIEIIGGPGQEFTVEGINFPMTDSDALPFAGKYRAEISPPQQNEFDNFLHVMQASPASTAQMASSELIESSSSVGAKIADWIVVFSRDGQELNQAQYSVSASAATTNVMADLSPYYEYEVRDGTSVIGTYTANEAGLIEFDLPAGSHEIIAYQGAMQLCEDAGGNCMDSVCASYSGCAYSNGYCQSGYCCLGTCAEIIGPCDEADTSDFGIISMNELISFINQWKQGSATIVQLMDSIQKWKNGC